MFGKQGGLVLLTFSLLAATIITVDPPIWPNQWSQELVIQTEQPKQTTSGKFWYDYTNKHQRYDVKNGQVNIFCRTVNPGYKSSCTQIISAGNLYIAYPELQKCCRCCSSQYGCGVESPEIYTTLKFLGQEDIGGESFYKWGQQTLDFNYYARKDEKLTPRRLDIPNHQRIDYVMQSYVVGDIDPKVFEIPSYCKSDCPRQTFCGNFEPGI